MKLLLLYTQAFGARRILPRETKGQKKQESKQESKEESKQEQNSGAGKQKELQEQVGAEKGEGVMDIALTRNIGTDNIIPVLFLVIFDV